ncbi:MAG: hypothetical protein QXQ21_08255 [Candidatus Jordarchaeales archaeon]
MKKYTTIPVLVEVKRILDEARSGREWSEFLLSLLNENKRLQRVLAARSLQERFNLVEKSVLESHEKFREGFKFRGEEEEQS